MLSNEAEVFSDMLADEETHSKSNDAIESMDIRECPPQAIESSEPIEELAEAVMEDSILEAEESEQELE